MLLLSLLQIIAFAGDPNMAVNHTEGSPMIGNPHAEALGEQYFQYENRRNVDTNIEVLQASGSLEPEQAVNLDDFVKNKNLAIKTKIRLSDEPKPSSDVDTNVKPDTSSKGGS